VNTVGLQEGILPQKSIHGFLILLINPTFSLRKVNITRKGYNSVARNKTPFIKFSQRLYFVEEVEEAMWVILKGNTEYLELKELSELGNGWWPC
jgi:hypothetical protein